MGTTADKLNAVLASKNAIKAAISEKTGGDAGDVMSTYASQILNIQSGGGDVVAKPSKDVNFYDYDGTILHSYTWAEAQALTELPSAPQHDGLIFDGWNYTLEEIKAEDGMCDVGAMYVTDDGKTRLYVTIPIDSFTVQLAIYQSASKGVTIDWGDGSTSIETAVGQILPSHTYATKGEYVITLEVTSGYINISRGTSSYNIMGSIGNQYRARIAILHKVEIGANVNSFSTYSFYYCVNLKSITIPRSIAEIAMYSFYYCYSLRHINFPRVANLGSSICRYAQALKSVSIPPSVTTLGSYMFANCTSLTRLNVPNNTINIDTYMTHSAYSLTRLSLSPKITVMGAYSIYNSYSLSELKIPAALTSINANAFSGCYCILVYDFTECTVVPTLAATSAFTNTHSSSKFYVPAALYDEWVAATNWKNYASRIVAVE